MSGTDIGIDLGTASILVYIKGKGVVLKEPSVVAFDRDDNKIKAIGEDARLMIGRTPGNIVVVRPLRQGVISNYTVTEQMMKHFINKAIGHRILRRKPMTAVCVPSGVSEVEKREVVESLRAAGARKVCLIETVVAAALGAVFLHETLTAQSLAGMGLILLGIFTAGRSGKALQAPARYDRMKKTIS